MVYLAKGRHSVCSKALQPYSNQIQALASSPGHTLLPQATPSFPRPHPPTKRGRRVWPGEGGCGLGTRLIQALDLYSSHAERRVSHWSFISESINYKQLDSSIAINSMLLQYCPSSYLVWKRICMHFHMMLQVWEKRIQWNLTNLMAGPLKSGHLLTYCGLN